MDLRYRKPTKRVWPKGNSKVQWGISFMFSIYIYIIFYYYYFIFLKKRFKSLTAQVKMKGERAEKDPESTWQINHARKLSSTHGL